MREEHRESITKMDVVSAFIPNASKASVSQWFRREVHQNKALMRALRREGYRKTLRTLSWRMYELIKRRGEFLDGSPAGIEEQHDGNEG